MLASRMVIAEPRRLPAAIFLMKRGTSMWVGHAAVQGASKQKRQRLASTTASCGAKAGCSSGIVIRQLVGPGILACRGLLGRVRLGRLGQQSSGGSGGGGDAGERFVESLAEVVNV